MTTPTETVETMCSTLGYSEQWISFGCIAPILLYNQYLSYTTGTDPHREHYRYRAFQELLHTESFNDEQLEHYLVLAQIDQNQAMAQAALIDLLLWPKLKEEQYRTLCVHPSFQTERIQKIIQKNALTVQLREQTLSDEQIDRIIRDGDSRTQRLLLEFSTLTLEQYEALQHSGKSRAVRHLATQARNDLIRKAG